MNNPCDLDEDGVPHELARYSSAEGYSYFGWDDAVHMDAEKLAGLFVTRFPRLCKASAGRDWEYAGWVSELSGYMSRTQSLPFVMEEYFVPGPEDLNYLPFGGDHTSKDFPLPPRTDANASELKEEAAQLRIKLIRIEERVEKARKILDGNAIQGPDGQDELFLA
jgi:hypothetical protein